ncbi:glycoside hydrolase family 16 protein [Catenulispora rubra]|uniref:glycoside hydrolase family 16 protein n=1 Tax=Catenulispora rubra TaxID=280293 RepID=UPI0018922C1D|nr:glycoside hydrolase family 16 protein [Catenulispora rubra]
MTGQALRRSNATNRLAAVAFVAALAVGGFGAPPASAASAASVTVTEDSLSINPSAPATSSSVRATLVVHASGTLPVQALTVAVRSSGGAGYDFTGAEAVTLTTSKLTFQPNAETFPAGTYTYFGAYEVGGVWTNLPSKTFLVKPPAGAAPAGIPGSWNSTFDDEFDEGSLANDHNWSTVSPFGRWGSANNTWCSTGPTQQITGGELVLQELNEACDGSSSALTGGIVSTGPGYATNPVTLSPGDAVEAEVYASPGSKGITNWPAFWLDGQDPWPSNGEIDAMEGLDGSACYHIHWGTPANPQAAGGCPTGDHTGWHTYGADWQADGTVVFYYDGTEVGSEYLNTASPQYIVLDLASANDSGATTTTGTAGEMKVAYVRAWQPAS